MNANKVAVLAEIASRAGKKVIVEIGCGAQKEHEDSIAIDLIEYRNVELVGAVDEVLPLFPSESVDEIYSRHFLEHVENPQAILCLAAQALRPGGRLEITVPHFSNPYFWSDPTHRRPFGLYSFCYFAESALFRRSVPKYAIIRDLRLVDVQLGFRSVRPFYLRHVLRRIFGGVVNMSRFAQEFYEDALSNLISCYEVTAVMTKVRGE